MKALRWIAAFPVAMVASFVAWLLLSSVITGATVFPGFVGRVIGYSPIVVLAALPTVVFVVAATWISPRKSRRVAFVFFGLSLFFSGGGLESLRYHQLGMGGFWIASLIGVVLGAVVGLLVSLRFVTRGA